MTSINTASDTRERLSQEGTDSRNRFWKKVIELYSFFFLASWAIRLEEIVAEEGVRNLQMKLKKNLLWWRIYGSIFTIRMHLSSSERRAVEGGRKTHNNLVVKKKKERTLTSSICIKYLQGVHWEWGIGVLWWWWFLVQESGILNKIQFKTNLRVCFGGIYLSRCAVRLPSPIQFQARG